MPNIIFEPQDVPSPEKSFWVPVFAALFVFTGLLGMSRGVVLFMPPAPVEQLLEKFEEAQKKTAHMSVSEADRERIALLFKETEAQLRERYTLEKSQNSRFDQMFLWVSFFLSLFAILIGKNLKSRKEWARKLAICHVLVSFPLVLRTLFMNYTKALNSGHLRTLGIQSGLFQKLDLLASLPSNEELATIQIGFQLSLALMWLILVLWFFTRRNIKREFQTIL